MNFPNTDGHFAWQLTNPSQWSWPICHVCGVFGAFWRIFNSNIGPTIWLLCSKQAKVGRHWCFGWTSNSVNVNWRTAARVGELWKIQLRAEPRASGGMNTLSRGEHRFCFSNFCLKILPLVVFTTVQELSLIWLLNGGEMYLLHKCMEKRKKRHCRIAGRNRVQVGA